MLSDVSETKVKGSGLDEPKTTVKEVSTKEQSTLILDDPEFYDDVASLEPGLAERKEKSAEDIYAVVIDSENNPNTVEEAFNLTAEEVEVDIQHLSKRKKTRRKS